MIELGRRGRDIITGYSGICMASARYLTGCNQVMLVPTELDEKGNRREGEWFDDVRVEPVGDEVIQLSPDGQRPTVSPGCDEPAPPKQ